MKLLRSRANQESALKNNAKVQSCFGIRKLKKFNKINLGLNSQNVRTIKR